MLKPKMPATRRPKRKIALVRKEVKSAFPKELGDILKNVHKNSRHMLNSISSADAHTRMAVLKSFMETARKNEALYGRNAADLFSYFALRDQNLEVRHYALESIRKYNLLPSMERFRLANEIIANKDTALFKIAREMQKEAREAINIMDRDLY